MSDNSNQYLQQYIEWKKSKSESQQPPVEDYAKSIVSQPDTAEEYRQAYLKWKVERAGGKYQPPALDASTIAGARVTVGTPEVKTEEKTNEPPKFDPTLKLGQQLYYDQDTNSYTSKETPIPVYRTQEGAFTFKLANGVRPAVFDKAAELYSTGKSMDFQGWRLDPSVQVGDRIYYDVERGVITSQETLDTVPLYRNQQIEGAATDPIRSITISPGETSAPLKLDFELRSALIEYNKYLAQMEEDSKPAARVAESIYEGSIPLTKEGMRDALTVSANNKASKYSSNPFIAAAQYIFGKGEMLGIDTSNKGSETIYTPYAEGGTVSLDDTKAGWFGTIFNTPSEWLQGLTGTWAALGNEFAIGVSKSISGSREAQGNLFAPDGTAQADDIVQSQVELSSSKYKVSSDTEAWQMLQDRADAAREAQNQANIARRTSDATTRIEAITKAREILVESYQKERVGNAWLNSKDIFSAGDPTFSWGLTDPNQYELFSNARADAEIQLGRPLYRNEIIQLRNRFSDPVQDMVGSLVYDPLNLLEILSGGAAIKAVSKLPMGETISKALSKNIAGKLLREFGDDTTGLAREAKVLLEMPDDVEDVSGWVRSINQQGRVLAGDAWKERSLSYISGVEMSKGIFQVPNPNKTSLQDLLFMSQVELTKNILKVPAKGLEKVFDLAKDIPAISKTFDWIRTNSVASFGKLATEISIRSTSAKISRKASSVFDSLVRGKTNFEDMKDVVSKFGGQINDLNKLRLGNDPTYLAERMKLAESLPRWFGTTTTRLQFIDDALMLGGLTAKDWGDLLMDSIDKVTDKAIKEYIEKNDNPDTVNRLISENPDQYRLILESHNNDSVAAKIAFLSDLAKREAEKSFTLTKRGSVMYALGDKFSQTFTRQNSIMRGVYNDDLINLISQNALRSKDVRKLRDLVKEVADRARRAGHLTIVTDDFEVLRYLGWKDMPELRAEFDRIAKEIPGIGLDMGKDTVDDAFEKVMKAYQTPRFRVGLGTGLIKHQSIFTFDSFVRSWMRGWLDVTLALKPGWVVGNYISSTVQYLTFGGLRSMDGLFTLLDNTPEEVVKKLGVYPGEFTTAVLHRNTERWVDPKMARLGPASFFAYLRKYSLDRTAEWKQIYGNSNLFVKGWKWTKDVGFRTVIDSVYSANDATEAGLRIRMWWKMFSPAYASMEKDVTKVLNASLEKKMTELGLDRISQERVQKVIDQIWKGSGLDAARLEKLSQSISSKWVGTPDASFFIPLDIYDTPVADGFENLNTFIQGFLGNLRSFIEFETANGRKVTRTSFNDFMHEIETMVKSDAAETAPYERTAFLRYLAEASGEANDAVDLKDEAVSLWSRVFDDADWANNSTEIKTLAEKFIGVVDTREDLKLRLNRWLNDPLGIEKEIPTDVPVDELSGDMSRSKEAKRMAQSRAASNQAIGRLQSRGLNFSSDVSDVDKLKATEYYAHLVSTNLVWENMEAKWYSSVKQGLARVFTGLANYHGAALEDVTDESVKRFYRITEQAQHSITSNVQDRTLRLNRGELIEIPMVRSMFDKSGFDLKFDDTGKLISFNMFGDREITDQTRLDAFMHMVKNYTNNLIRSDYLKSTKGLTDEELFNTVLTSPSTGSLSLQKIAELNSKLRPRSRDLNAILKDIEDMGFNSPIEQKRAILIEFGVDGVDIRRGTTKLFRNNQNQKEQLINFVNNMTESSLAYTDELTNEQVYKAAKTYRDLKTYADVGMGRATTVQFFENKMRKILMIQYGMSPETAEHTMNVMQAIAGSTEAYYGDKLHFWGNVVGSFRQDGSLGKYLLGDTEGMIKGMTDWTSSGKAVLYSLNHADPTTVLHEFFHAVRGKGTVSFIPDEARKVLDDWAKANGAVTEEDILEFQAVAFENYILRGIAPTTASLKLKNAFGYLKDVFSRIWSYMKGKMAVLAGKDAYAMFDGDVKLTDEVTDVFDQLVTSWRKSGTVAPVPHPVKETPPKYPITNLTKVKKKAEWEIARDKAKEVFAKRTKDMTVEEKDYALLHDELTGLKSRRAYNEDPRKPFVVFFDIEGLKWVNDNLGHGTGDNLLKAMGEAVLESAGEANGYRGSSRADEFIMQFETEQQAREAAQKLVDLLAAKQVELEAGGKPLSGFGANYGIGKSLSEADQDMIKGKVVSVAEGRRAARGEKPVGITLEPPVIEEVSIQPVIKSEKTAESNWDRFKRLTEPTESNWERFKRLTEQSGEPTETSFERFKRLTEQADTPTESNYERFKRLVEQADESGDEQFEKLISEVQPVKIEEPKAPVQPEMIKEPAKIEEPPKVVEPVQVEPAKVIEPVQVEPAKVIEPVQVEPAKVIEPEISIHPEVIKEPEIIREPVKVVEPEVVEEPVKIIEPESALLPSYDEPLWEMSIDEIMEVFRGDDQDKKQRLWRALTFDGNAKLEGQVSPFLINMYHEAHLKDAIEKKLPIPDKAFQDHLKLKYPRTARVVERESRDAPVPLKVRAVRSQVFSELKAFGETATRDIFYRDGKFFGLSGKVLTDDEVEEIVEPFGLSYTRTLDILDEPVSRKIYLVKSDEGYLRAKMQLYDRLRESLLKEEPAITISQDVTVGLVRKSQVVTPTLGNVYWKDDSIWVKTPGQIRIRLTYDTMTDISKKLGMNFEEATKKYMEENFGLGSDMEDGRDKLYQFSRSVPFEGRRASRNETPISANRVVSVDENTVNRLVSRLENGDELLDGDIREVQKLLDVEDDPRLSGLLDGTYDVPDIILYQYSNQNVSPRQLFQSEMYKTVNGGKEIRPLMESVLMRTFYTKHETPIRYQVITDLNEIDPVAEGMTRIYHSTGDAAVEGINDKGILSAGVLRGTGQDVVNVSTSPDMSGGPIFVADIPTDQLRMVNKAWGEVKEIAPENIKAIYLNHYPISDKAYKTVVKEHPQTKIVDKLKQMVADNAESPEQLTRDGLPLWDYEDIYGIQEIGSAKTSRAQVPAVFTRVKWEPGTINADIGGGKFENSTEFLTNKGVTNLIYDPYNRSKEHNTRVADQIRNSQADTVTVANVLNVIKEPNARDHVLRQAADAVKPDGKVYISVYEGSGEEAGSGLGRVTRDGWQEYRKLESYLPEVRKRFENAEIKNGYIVASNPIKETPISLFQKAESPDSPEFHKWFDGSKVVDKDGKPLELYHGTPKGGFEEFIPQTKKKQQMGFGIHFTENETFAQGYAENKLKIGSRGGKPKKGQVYTVYASIKNPLYADQVVREGSPEWALAEKLIGSRKKLIPFTGGRDENGLYAVYLQRIIDQVDPEKAQKIIQEAGYDGVRYEAEYLTPTISGGRFTNALTSRDRSWVVFNSNQVKSIANKGGWNPEDANILFQKTSMSVPDRNWFEGSRIVDKDGNPLMVYHGTNKEIIHFDPNMAKETDIAGIYFTKSAEDAGMYSSAWGAIGANVIPVYLRVTNPATMEDLRQLYKETGLVRKRDGLKIKEELIKRGFDGVMTNSEIIVFDNNQIRNALTGEMMQAARKWIDIPEEAVSEVNGFMDAFLKSTIPGDGVSILSWLQMITGDKQIGKKDIEEILNAMNDVATRYEADPALVGYSGTVRGLMDQIKYAAEYHLHVNILKDKFMPPPISMKGMDDGIRTWTQSNRYLAGQTSAALDAISRIAENGMDVVDQMKTVSPEEMEAIQSWGSEASRLKAEMISKASNGGTFMGKAYTDAIGAVNSSMLDYSSTMRIDEWMRSIIPFWMYYTRTPIYYAKQFLRHPVYGAFYAKYSEYSKKSAYDKGLVNSAGEQLPSMKGYVPLFGDLWWNPTSALMFKFFDTKSNENLDLEDKDMSPVEKVLYVLYNESQNRGFAFHPMLAALLSQTKLTQYPTESLTMQTANIIFPIFDLLPPTAERWLMQKMDAVAGTIIDVPETYRPRTPWQDYNVELMILQDLKTRMDKEPDLRVKRQMAKEVGDLLADRQRYSNPKWIQWRDKFEASDYTKNMVGRVTGLYLKSIDPAYGEILDLRNRINIIKAGLNDDLVAAVFDQDIDATKRYSNYLNTMNETPEGWLYDPYLKMRATYNAAGESVYGQERIDLMANRYAEDERREQYYEAMRSARAELEANLKSLPIGNRSDQRSKFYADYFEQLNIIDANYPDVGLSQQSMLKPEEAIAEDYKTKWWRMIASTMPKWDADQQTYAEWQADVERWKAELPMLGNQLMPIFAQNIAIYQTKLVEKGKGQNLANIPTSLLKVTTGKEYDKWEKEQDTIYDAIQNAWDDLYLNKYYELNNYSGAERAYKEMEWKKEHPIPPTTAEIWNWIDKNYHLKWSKDEVFGEMESRPISTIDEYQTVDKSEASTKADQVWKWLSQITPGEKRNTFNAALKSIGVNPDDIYTWYEFYDKVDRKKLETSLKFKQYIDTIYDSVQQAVQVADIQPLTEAEITDWYNAVQIDKVYKATAVTRYGSDIFELNTLYGQKGYTEKQNYKRTPEYARLRLFWNWRDQWASQNPLWKQFYLPD